MARESSLTSASYVTVIFLEENGCPMKFYIKPGATKNKILPLIERGGGDVVSFHHCSARKVIKLSDPEEPTEGHVSTEFIFDSVEKQFLQDIEKYRFKQRKSKRVVKVVPYFQAEIVKSFKTYKRLKYTKAEEMAIIDYIENNDTFGMSIYGNKLWQYMASIKVTKHSWQSMRTRYLKFLMKPSKHMKGQLLLTNENLSPEAYSSGSESDFEVNIRQNNSKKNSEKQSLVRQNITRSQRRALVSSSDDTDDPLSHRVQTRSLKRASESDVNSDPNARILRKRSQGKVLSSTTDDIPDHSLHQRFQRVLQNNRTEKESERPTDDSPMVDLQKGLTTGHKKVSESSSELESEFESQPVPRQVTPVVRRKSDHSGFKLATKRRSSPRKGNTKDKMVLDIDPETRITTARSNGESESDEFDKRLMDLAEKTSLNFGGQESPKNDKDEESESETSAKDTQEEDDDAVLFDKKKKTKRKEKNKNKKISSPRRKQTDIDKTNIDKHTRCQSSEKSSEDQVSSTDKNQSSPKVSEAGSSNTKATPKSLQWVKTDLTLESCSRQLFGKKDNKESMLGQSKGETRKLEKSQYADQATENTRMWYLVEKMFENYQKVERLPCAQGMTKPEMLHALYVSNGSLEDTKNYIKKGRLSDGASPWSNLDNDAILANDKEAVESYIKKRGKINVLERRSFLRGCR